MQMNEENFRLVKLVSKKIVYEMSTVNDQFSILMYGWGETEVIANLKKP